MREAYIVSAVRTPIGRMGGGLKDVQPDVLTEIVITEAIKRVGMGSEHIDEVIIGQAKQSADCPNIARVAALRAHIPVEIPAYTVMRQCGSGMQAVLNAYQIIASDMGDVVVAGGVESMSNAPYYLRGARYGYKAGNAVLVDSNTESQPKSQPEEIYGTFTMGMTAENIAKKLGITREEQDEFSLDSQAKADKAISEGRFREEIVGIELKDAKGKVTVFNTDENPRRVTMEQLERLKPVFKEGGTVTAGNSSSRNDGAAALVLMSAEEIKRRSIRPLARIVSAQASGVSPEIMGLGPVPATIKALQKSGLTLADIGLIELNEAFAAQSLGVIKELGFNREILNVNGGAIALGHPLGCSGARILTTLIYEMKKRNVRYGLATICIAGGLGMAVIAENII